MACAIDGGCPSDYIAIAIAIICTILLFIRATFPFLVYKIPRTKSSGIWLLVLQTFASVNFLLSLVMFLSYLKFKRGHWWRSCYIWAVWVEGPFGFGLLMCCRIVQAFQLYYLFVKRRLPPIRSRILLPLILLPWIGTAAAIQIGRPLTLRCHMGNWFQEFKDLLLGIVTSSTCIGIWITSYVLNEIHDQTRPVQVISRFLLLVSASILVLTFFSISPSQPLLSQMSLRRREAHEFETMGQALGIPDSGLLLPRAIAVDIDMNEPLDKLLLNKRFRHSFMAFADSCLAGESVHFYDEVYEFSKIPVVDTVRRVYMARHIIEKYIQSGSDTEVNISHRTREGILSTTDLAHSNLFNCAISELLQLMKMNLLQDYWSSMFFVKFKEELRTKPEDNECMERVVGWDYSPRLSIVHGVDDPFHQEHPQKGSPSEM
ncbi:hypothetical protein AAC387_Pa12g1091 [Persea americana]